VAKLQTSGYLADSQRPALDSKLGLPVRTPEEVTQLPLQVPGGIIPPNDPTENNVDTQNENDA